MFTPLTYLVDALRGAMIVGDTSRDTNTTSFGVMVLVFLGLLGQASRLYPGLAH